VAREPIVETRNRKKLRPNPLAPWELRIGKARVFYDVEESVSLKAGRKPSKKSLQARSSAPMTRGDAGTESDVDNFATGLDNVEEK